LRAIENAFDLDGCPLGAGAAGGTSVPIDSERTAELLGFARGVVHSVDAVASRDVVLRILSAATILGVTLSRVGKDLQLWSTAEFGLISFPDSFVGSSSMMPQKRNAFVLEHLLGRSSFPAGALMAAVTAMHGVPFTNSISAGTEGIRPLWAALDDTTQSLIFATVAIRKAEPQPERMYARAVDGHSVATELANHLVLHEGLAFRTAHRQVGQLVNSAISRHEPLADTAGQMMADTEWLGPSQVVARTRYGGGPGPESIKNIVAELRDQWKLAARRLSERVQGWRDARHELQLATSTLPFRETKCH
jgi:argininosuccinate lyase